MGGGGSGGEFEVAELLFLLLLELERLAGTAMCAVRGSGAGDGRLGRAGGGGREREGAEESGWACGRLLEGRRGRRDVLLAAVEGKRRGEGKGGEARRKKTLIDSYASDWGWTFDAEGLRGRRPLKRAPAVCWLIVCALFSALL